MHTFGGLQDVGLCLRFLLEDALFTAEVMRWEALSCRLNIGILMCDEGYRQGYEATAHPACFKAKAAVCC